MSANRGKFVSNIAALRPTDALATPGRSVDGFEGVFVSWALSASRGLFPSRGRAFCVAMREAGWDVGKAGGTAGGGNARKSRRLQEVQFAAIPRLCGWSGRSRNARQVCRRFFRGWFCVVGFVRAPGAVPFAGAGLFAWRRAKRGGALAKRAERLGTGLFAWRRAATVTTFG